MIDIEEAILGALLINPESFWKIADKITAIDFAKPSHQRVYSWIGENLRTGKQVDAVLLGEHLPEFREFAITLATSYFSAAQITYYADTLRTKAEARRLANVGLQISKCETYGDAQALLATVRPQQTQKIKSVQDGLREFVTSLQARYDADGGMTGVSSGIESLDTLTGGFQAGDLVIVAARPSMGKTAASLQCALGAGRALIFSLEMTAGKLIERAVANIGDLPYRWIRFPIDAPDHASYQVMEASKLVNDLKILIDDSAGISADQICSRARQAHMVEPLTAVIIDHLGLISRAGRHDASELGQITTALKALAKELNLPVILLCQLNRKVEEEKNKKPALSHLRDSGRIEEDADIVIFLHRAEYYQLEPKGYCEFIVAKARDGETGKAWAKSKLANMRLESCDEPEYTESTGSTASANGSRGFQSGSKAANEPREFSRTGTYRR